MDESYWIFQEIWRLTLDNWDTAELHLWDNFICYYDFVLLKKAHIAQSVVCQVEKCENGTSAEEL